MRSSRFDVSFSMPRRRGPFGVRALERQRRRAMTVASSCATSDLREHRLEGVAIDGQQRRLGRGSTVASALAVSSDISPKNAPASFAISFSPRRS